MRILFYNWEYPPVGSGIGQYIYFMSRALRRVGHFTVIVTSKHNGLPEEEQVDNGIVFRCFNKDEMNENGTVDTVLTIAAEQKVDFIEGADHLGGCRSLLSRKDRPPVVIKMHYNDVLYRLRYAHVYYSWQKAAIWLACFRQRTRIRNERYCLEHADMVIAPCKLIVETAQKQGVSFSAPPEVIPNSTLSPSFWTNKEADKPTILFVGRVDFGKGVGFLPQIVKQVAKIYPTVKFELAGSAGQAWGVGSVESWLSKKLGSLIQFVNVYGQVERDKLDELYKKAWLVIVPSKWDTFPNVVLEAMAREKPIIASRNGGMAEMLSGTDNVIVNSDNSGKYSKEIIQMLSDKKCRIAAGKSGFRKYNQEYSGEAVVKNYIQLMSAVS